MRPETRGRWIALSERYRDYGWPAIKTSDYPRLLDDGELKTRTRAIPERRSVLGVLAITECIEGRGRFLDQVINGIFVICEETTWVPPLHRVHGDKSSKECMPTVRGVLQEPGAQFRALNAAYIGSEAATSLSLDIAQAYPAEAGIENWQRTFKLERAEQPPIEVSDRYCLREATADIFYSLVTPFEPIPSGEGRFRLEYAPGRWAVLEFEAAHLEPAVEPIETMESRLKRNWGERMYRIVLREQTSAASGTRKLLIYRQNEMK